MKKCVYSGTFDPPTAGHKSVIEKCLKIFDKVVVAVMVNPQKEPFLTAAERVTLLKKLFCGNEGVEVCAFSGAAVDLLEREQTPFYVRGVRDAIDLDYENRDRYASEKLKSDLITVYIPAEQDETHISSSLVKNSVKFKKDFKNYVPAEIAADFEEILRNKGLNYV